MGGVHRFVFGKHSGAGAVEEVLKAHAQQLAAQGLVVDDALVARLLDRVKEDRARMIESGHTGAAIRAHYEAMAQLGVSERQLVEAALRLHAEERSKAGA